MKNILGQLGLVAAMFALSLPAFAKDALANIYGSWKIQTILGGGAVSSLSRREAQKMIGKAIMVEARRYIFNGQACEETSYEVNVEDTAGHFARAWNTAVREIPLPDPVTVIDTGCSTLYPLKNGKLMVAEQGVFFEAVRTQRASSR